MTKEIIETYVSCNVSVRTMLEIEGDTATIKDLIVDASIWMGTGGLDMCPKWSVDGDEIVLRLSPNFLREVDDEMEEKRVVIDPSLKENK